MLDFQCPATAFPHLKQPGYEVISHPASGFRFSNVIPPLFWHHPGGEGGLADAA